MFSSGGKPDSKGGFPGPQHLNCASAVAERERLVMGKSIVFEGQRATASRAAQKATGAAKIGGFTLDDWKTRLGLVDTKIKAESSARTDLLGAAAVWDGHLREVYDLTRHAAALSKKRFKNEPDKLALFASLEASDSSRALICTNGTDLVPIWRKADPAWAPVEGATLPALEGLLAQCDLDRLDHADKLAVWRKAASTLNGVADTLHDDNVAWYAAATRQFAEGTPDGDMIRSTVPVTTEMAVEVGPAVIKNLLAACGTVRFDAEAPHATTFTYLHHKPGASEWATLQADTVETAVTVGGLTPGEHRFKAVGANAQGLGPESAEVVVVIAQANAA